ncbi:MAG: ABC transporter ATP-binding protein/permease [Clostridia bacterium]|nr:ABC transporter ATP-binding protein/permease [Clostridia bacterium]
MLELRDIKKDYAVAGGAVHALKGISLNFRKNEFVSILGASGCGKTTLLNIIGGLDKYTSGDLLINGVSTKQYGDRDWDTYRNHSIGFIFQSYHLIPHQTILQNVELALTISGVDREERRRRAIEALDKVGLKDRIHNRPNQLSGGQAQRVAIARALINDPEIVLADEPTGALDSKTSVQIMELLKEISKDRLVIMVTHNPELAEQYSTRIIRLLDGLVTDDSMPYDGAEPPLQIERHATNKGKKKRSSMSFGMAFMLSLKNLLSKMRRTTMVAVAGSIGIIGVSMVLAISSGVQGYIKSMEDDMLSGYPLTITETALDFDALMDFSAGKTVDITKLQDGKIYVDSLLETLMGMDSSMTTNKIDRNYISYVDAMPKEYYNALQYGYGFNLANNIYTDFKITDKDIPAEADASGNYSITAIRQMYTSVLLRVPDYAQYTAMISSAGSFHEIPDNYSYIMSQYDILATDGGKTEKLTENELKDIFENKESLIIVVDDKQIDDITLGQFGYFTQEEFLNFAYRAQIENGKTSDDYEQGVIQSYLDGKNYDFFVGENAKTFTWYPNDSIYTLKEDGDVFYTINTDDREHPIPMNITEYVTYKYNHSSENISKTGAVPLKVKAILQKKEGISYGCLSSGIYYTNELTKHMLETSKTSSVAKYVKENGSAMIPFNYEFSYFEDKEFHKSEMLVAPYIPNTGFVKPASGMMSMMMGGATDRMSLSALGGDDLPVSVSIYPLNFDSKDLITEYLDKWNDACESDGGVLEFTDADGNTVKYENLSDVDVVKYTDTVGLIIMMVNTMIQMITIALVAFTALSLVVSTVMVGIITYVSVVERIKEIGILRSVGARKKDIKRLFIAETFIIGLSAGLVGIAVTYILSFIINMIVGALAGIYTIASLPVGTAFIMVLVSVILTLISGLIPASAAAKKDPVVALRTE